MADITLAQPVIVRPNLPRLPRRLRARWRKFGRDLRHDLFCFGRSDRQLADLGRARTPRYDWIGGLTRR